MFTTFFSQQTNNTSAAIITSSIEHVDILKIDSLRSKNRSLLFTNLTNKIEELNRINTKWESLSDKFKSETFNLIKDISCSLQTDEVLKLDYMFKRINLSFNEFPYEVIRLCVSAHFQKAVSSSEWKDVISFCEWLIQLNLAKENLPSQDINKLVKTINEKLSPAIDAQTLVRVQNVLYYFDSFIPHKTHQLFLNCEMTKVKLRVLNKSNDVNHPVYENVRLLHSKCHAGKKPSHSNITDLMDFILNNKNLITPREISSICASLGKADFRWDVYPRYASNIKLLLIKHIPNMDSNQLISLLKDRSAIHLINKESVHKKSSLLQLIIDRFVGLAEKIHEDELILCYKSIVTIDRFKLDIFQIEKKNFLNTFYSSFIKNHKVGFNSYQSLLDAISQFTKHNIKWNELDEKFQKFIINYLNSCSSPFDHAKPVLIPRILLELEKLGMTVDQSNMSVINLLIEKGFNHLDNLSIMEKIHFIYFMQSLEMRNNSLLKKHIGLLLTKIKDEVFTTSFSLKHIKHIRQVLLNHDDLSILESYLKSSFKQDLSTMEIPKAKRQFQSDFFTKVMNSDDEKQLINKHFESLSYELSIKQEVDSASVRNGK